MRYPIGIGPELRSNIDYVFLFNEQSILNRKKLYHHYGSIVSSFEDFNHIFNFFY